MPPYLPIDRRQHLYLFQDFYELSPQFRYIRKHEYRNLLTHRKLVEILLVKYYGGNTGEILNKKSFNS